ncbi:ATP-binding protein [Marivivens donghaensis]|nr:ATP-binding protein [Marivivens donghaensis]MCL7408137.1 ATP-binding protein [Marivivens donghaensis]MDN3703882.1 ATP-binding protein [Marivivens donghaensis]
MHTGSARIDGPIGLSVLAFTAIISVSLAGWVTEPKVTLFGYLCGGAMGLTAIFMFIRSAMRQYAQRRTLAAIEPIVSSNTEPTWVIGMDGSISLSNGAARSIDLSQLFASPRATILRFNAEARQFGRAHHNFQLKGEGSQLSVTSLPENVFLWALSTKSGVQKPDQPYLTEDDHDSLADIGEIDALPVPILKVAQTGEILFANQEARTLLGGQITNGTRLSDRLEGLGRPITDWLADVAASRSLNTREFLRGKGDRQDFFVQVALHPTGREPDSPLIAVLNDMTEFKSLEAQFVQSQKMQAIGQLAGGVAHDFNNLLTAISGHCELLLMRHREGDTDFCDLNQIKENTTRAARLVSQLLAFSRKQTLLPEVFDLSGVLANMTQLLDRLVGERIRLVLSQEDNLYPIRADKRQLEQVIMNLVVNARDAMPGGGDIRVESQNVTLAERLERDHARLPAGNYVLIKVIDEGHGIPSEKIGKIFEPFYSTKKPGEGTGLGLSTAYGIVKQSGGFIFVESEPDVGSIFSLYFPHFDGAVTDTLNPQVTEKPTITPRKGVVLLVEDEAPVRAFATRALQMKGLTVLEAESGEQALTLLEDPELVVDIFVSDVVMPGKDGPTWVKEARKMRPKTRVVFVSGYAEDAFTDHLADVGPSVFLTKPFSLADLTRTVEAELAAR